MSRCQTTCSSTGACIQSRQPSCHGRSCFCQSRKRPLLPLLGQLSVAHTETFYIRNVKPSGRRRSSLSALHLVVCGNRGHVPLSTSIDAPKLHRYFDEKIAALDMLAPFITELFNRSLSSYFKAAFITPLLKKSNLDPSDGQSYRHIEPQCLVKVV